MRSWDITDISRNIKKKNTLKFDCEAAIIYNLLYGLFDYISK